MLVERNSVHLVRGFLYAKITAGGVRPAASFLACSTCSMVNITVYTLTYAFIHLFHTIACHLYPNSSKRQW